MSINTNKIKYRPEIDGLRAIAVLSVVLYHAGLAPAAGFVGVDVFFVISGYLITALLHKEWLESGRINLVSFYARRMRRIFPALVLVVTSTVVASTILLSPYGEVRQLTQSAAASLLFVSNIFFEITSGGYFDGDSGQIPLLHIWSLAVEEQFYLLWPLLLIIIFRLRSRLLVPVIAALMAGSFLLAEVLMYNSPETAFYQMPARFWELAIGGLVALRPADKTAYGRTVACAGLALLLAAINIPTPHFPAIGALPAVAGATLLIYAVHGKTELGLAGAWLRSRPMVFFGLISYSLYLWHWPLLAIDKATRTGESPLEIRVLLCVVAIVLAWISYRFVEQPFRRPNIKESELKVVVAGLAASVALAIGALTLGEQLQQTPPKTDLASITSQDWPKNRFECHYRGTDSLAVFPKPDCTSIAKQAAKVVIWGDSTALAWQPFAWAIGEVTNMSATAYSRDACPPALDYDNGKPFREEKYCREFNQLVMKQLAGVDTLILSAVWSSAELFNNRFAETIKRVSPVVRKIILLGPTPHLKDTAPRCIRNQDLDACATSRREFEEHTARARNFLKSIAEKNDAIEYIDVTDFFCTTDTCTVLKNGYALYWDSYHVSATAARNFSTLYLSDKHH